MLMKYKIIETIRKHRDDIILAIETMSLIIELAMLLKN